MGSLYSDNAIVLSSITNQEAKWLSKSEYARCVKMNSSDLKMQNSASHIADSKTTAKKEGKARRSGKLIHGVGINDYDCRVSDTINGKQVFKPFYRTWKSMLCRCYSELYQIKGTTYKGCSVSKEWLSLSNFKEWHDVNYVEGWQLDKDLIVDGNKVYGSKFCRYVPGDLNKILTDRRALRGSSPQGVCYHKSVGKFASHVKVDGKQKFLGYFATTEEASSAYQVAKAKCVISKAESYRGVVCSDVLNALIKRFKQQGDLDG